LSTTTKMGDSNPTNAIDRVARQMPPNQEMREMVMNSIEAGATQVSIHLCPQALNHNVKRLCVSDNGKGMTSSEMMTYLANMNSSSKASHSGYHENFGIGVKATTFRRNPYGVVFLSWTPETPEGYLLWMHYDENVGSYGVRSFPYMDEHGDLYHAEDSEGNPLIALTDNEKGLVSLEALYPEGFEGIKWWDCKPSFIKDHGTVVILCGENEHDSSFKTTERDPSYYLNERFWNVPAGVTITNSIGSRNIKVAGLGSLFSHTSSDLTRVLPFVRSSEVLVSPPEGYEGYEIEVYICEEFKDYTKHLSNSGAQDMGFKASKGMVAFVYKDEVYHFKHGSHEMNRWGVSIPSAQGHVRIVIRPPMYDPQSAPSGVYPSQERDTLYTHDENGYAVKVMDKISDLQEWFIDNHPQSLKDFLDDEAKGLVVSKSVEIPDLIAKFKSYFRKKLLKDSSSTEQVLVHDPAGGQTHSGTNSNGSGSGFSGAGQGRSAPNLSGNKSGNLPAVAQNVPKKEPVITPLWRNHKEESDDGSSHNFMVDGKVYPFVLARLGSSYLLYLNKDHDLFRKAHAYAVDNYIDSDRVSNQIEEIVHNIYENTMVVSLTHYLSARQKNPSLPRPDSNPDLLLGMGFEMWLTYEKILERVGKSLKLKRTK
jgi:hypothetical protein